MFMHRKSYVQISGPDRVLFLVSPTSEIFCDDQNKTKLAIERKALLTTIEIVRALEGGSREIDNVEKETKHVYS